MQEKAEQLKEWGVLICSKQGKRRGTKSKIHQTLFFWGYGTFKGQSHTEKLQFLPWGMDNLPVGDGLCVGAVLHPPQAPLNGSVSRARFGNSSLRCSLQLLHRSKYNKRILSNVCVCVHVCVRVSIGNQWRCTPEDITRKQIVRFLWGKWTNKKKKNRTPHPEKRPLGCHTHLGSVVKFLFF